MTTESDPKQTPSEGQDAGTRAGQALIDELTELGQKFADLVEVAWNSDERKRLEEDLRKGLVSVAENLETGLKKAGEKRETQEFIAKAEDVATKVRTSKIANELADALAAGLRQLSESMDKWTDEMRARAKKPDVAADASQDITIDRE